MSVSFSKDWINLNCGWIDLKKIGEYDDTLILVTADHGHGFVSAVNDLMRLL